MPPMITAAVLVEGVARCWSRPDTDARQKEPKDMATKKTTKPAAKKPAAKKPACKTGCKAKPAAKKTAKKK